jgi:site-specific DNA-adenine methylase
VTPEAKKLMKVYESVRMEVQEVIRKAYERHFGKPIETEFYKAPRRTRNVRRKAASP